MSINTVLDEIKKVILESEKIAKDDFYRKENTFRPNNNEFKSGWCTGIHFSWSIYDGEKSHITCFLEFDDIISPDSRVEKESDISPQDFIKKADRENVKKELREWLLKKITGEEYGGFYASVFKTYISVSIADNKEANLEEKIYDLRREKQVAQRVEKYILDKEYNNSDSKDKLSNCASVLVKGVYNYIDSNKIPMEQVSEILEGMLKNCKIKDYMFWGMLSFVHQYTADIKYNNGKFENVYNKEIDEHGLDFISYLGMFLLVNYKGSDARKGAEYLKLAKARGSKKASEIIKFGTGKIDASIMQYKDKKVSGIANDITAEVTLKIKDEDAESYDKLVKYLINLLKNGFTKQYKIKFNSKVKEYIPVKKLEQSQTNMFFNNVAKYPSVYHALKEYVKVAMSRHTYYAEGHEENCVSCGGYAVYAMGLASKDNFDIVAEFMKDNDSEHSLSPDYFASAFVEKWGINDDTKDIMKIVLSNINGNYFDASSENNEKIEKFKLMDLED